MDFLLELGTEEIPARMIDSASAELARRVSDLLARERLANDPQVTAMSTPRRLSIVATGVRERQSDITEQVTGPAVKVAYKDGEPTAAAHAFAKKANILVTALKRITTPKGEYIAADVTTKGNSAANVLAQSLPREIAAIYWAKNMYWRAGKPERFVRPVRWIVALLGDEVVPLEFAGVSAARESRGHRILGPEHVHVTVPNTYAEVLRRAHVVVRSSERREVIRVALDETLRNAHVPNAHSLRWRPDPALLDTVVNLTELPGVILGSFDEEFLSLPEEVLVTVMRDHQKYFAVENAAGRLAPHFLAVLNTDHDPEGIIRHGNERVLRARFNDARFFWQTDQKVPLTQRVDMLKAVTFQKDLGSYHAKTERVVALCEKLADVVERQRPTGDGGSSACVDREALITAARLAKTDLTTELVKEFTELQGIVGGLYARAQGLDEAVALAIYDQYKPASMEDAVPRTLEGALLSIADKADTIAGMFALGQIPSGSKDPFALRRAANGIVKTIAEHKLSLPISVIFQAAIAVQNVSGGQSPAGGNLSERQRFSAAEKIGKGITASAAAEGTLSAISGFFRERLEFYLRDSLGFSYDVVNAVLAAGSDDILDAAARAQAVAQVRTTNEFVSISTAFKRIKNILSQAQQKGIAITGKLSTSTEGDAEEVALEQLIARILPAYDDWVKHHKYSEALSAMAQLRAPIDAFFDRVMVMAEDTAKRDRRLALLHTINARFNRIADFSEIVTESKS
jgi:glycyl-tRNA synthetase beta chain